MSGYTGSIDFAIRDGVLSPKDVTLHDFSRAEIQYEHRCIQVKGQPNICLFFESENHLRAWAVDLCRQAMAKSTRVSAEERELVLNGVQPS